MKWMERKYQVGNVVEKIVGMVGNSTKPRKKKKKGATTERQFERNDRMATRRVQRIIAANFRPGDMLLTLNYSPEHLPANRKEADKDAENLIDRARRVMKREGIECKWILVTTEVDGETGEIVRLHHHIIMPRLAYEVICEKWTKGSVDYQLLKHQPDFTALAVYLLKQARREPDAKKYRCSRNLIHPAPVGERIVKPGHQPWIPRGAVVLERSEYTQESPCQYVRYLLPDKPTGRGSPPEKRKNRKETKINGE